MGNEALENIRQSRLIKKARNESGIKDEIRVIQRELVKQSFTSKKDDNAHKLLVERLKQLRSELDNIK